MTEYQRLLVALLGVIAVAVVSGIEDETKRSAAERLVQQISDEALRIAFGTNRA